MENKEKTRLQQPVIVCLLAILCCALWGSAFPGVKIGYDLFDISSSDTSTQILFAGIRFIFAGVLVILFGSISAKRLLLPKKSAYKKIAILSLFQTILQYLCFYIGLAHTTGVKSSILIGVNVFVAIFIAAIIFKQEKVTVVKIIGSFLGFAGIILVNINGTNMDMSFSINGDGLILLSTVAYGISSAVIKIYGKTEDSVMLSGYQFAFGGMVMTICGLFMGGCIHTFSLSCFIILIYLALVSAVAYTVWALLLKYNPVSNVAIYGFTNPIFGAVLSAIILRESGQTFGVKEIIALGLISLGIFMVQKLSTNVK